MARTKGATSDKTWADAIRRAVHSYHTVKDDDGRVQKIRWINILALKILEEAAAGDVQALKEIGDRLDGKPQQGVTADVSGTVNVTIDYGD